MSLAARCVPGTSQGRRRVYLSKFLWPLPPPPINCLVLDWVNAFRGSKGCGNGFLTDGACRRYLECNPLRPSPQAHAPYMRAIDFSSCFGACVFLCCLHLPLVLHFLSSLTTKLACCRAPCLLTVFQCVQIM